MFKSVPSRWGTIDTEIKDPLVGAQGYQRFSVSKPVLGQSIALHAGSFNFIYSKFLQSSTVECVLSSESEFVLEVGIRFVSPCLMSPFAVDWA